MPGNLSSNDFIIVSVFPAQENVPYGCAIVLDQLLFSYRLLVCLLILILENQPYALSLRFVVLALFALAFLRVCYCHKDKPWKMILTVGFLWI